MDLDFFRKIKEITLKAMFSDDDLMEMLVLKGGNAIDMIYNITGRASLDLDFSMQDDFDPKQLNLIEEKIVLTLKKTFQEHDYITFDIKFSTKPKKRAKSTKDFWGGYKVEFKIIEKDREYLLKENLDLARKDSIAIGPGNHKKMIIDISKYEYCEPKTEKELDGLTIYVYTLEMIVIEKLRAICQQLPEYKEIIGTHPKHSRARDFFDIYIILEKSNINLFTNDNIKLTKLIFDAKRVPLFFLSKIESTKAFHEDDYYKVMNTVSPIEELENFDFYFDYVVKLCDKLKSLWVK